MLQYWQFFFIYTLISIVKTMGRGKIRRNSVWYNFTNVHVVFTRYQIQNLATLGRLWDPVTLENNAK